MTRTPISCRLKLYKYDFSFPSGRRSTDSVVHEPRILDELRIDGVALNCETNVEMAHWFFDTKPKHFLLIWLQVSRNECECTVLSFDKDLIVRIQAFQPGASCREHADLAIHFCCFRAAPQTIQSWLLPADIGLREG